MPGGRLVVIVLVPRSARLVSLQQHQTYEQFQQAGTSHTNDVCSGAVLAYVEAEHGRDQVFELTRRLYEEPAEIDKSAFTAVGARDLQDLLAKAEAWL